MGEKKNLQQLFRSSHATTRLSYYRDAEETVYNSDTFFTFWTCAKATSLLMGTNVWNVGARFQWPSLKCTTGLFTGFWKWVALWSCVAVRSEMAVKLLHSLVKILIYFFPAQVDIHCFLKDVYSKVVPLSSVEHLGCGQTGNLLCPWWCRSSLFPSLPGVH